MMRFDRLPSAPKMLRRAPTKFSSAMATTRWTPSISCWPLLEQPEGVIPQILEKISVDQS